MNIKLLQVCEFANNNNTVTNCKLVYHNPWTEIYRNLDGLSEDLHECERADSKS